MNGVTPAQRMRGREGLSAADEAAAVLPMADFSVITPGDSSSAAIEYIGYFDEDWNLE